MQLECGAMLLAFADDIRSRLNDDRDPSAFQASGRCRAALQASAEFWGPSETGIQSRDRVELEKPVHRCEISTSFVIDAQQTALEIDRCVAARLIACRPSSR